MEFRRNSEYFLSVPPIASDILTLKLIPCFSEIQIYLGTLYFSELNNWRWLVLFLEGSMLSAHTRLHTHYKGGEKNKAQLLFSLWWGRLKEVDKRE